MYRHKREGLVVPRAKGHAHLYEHTHFYFSMHIFE